MKGFNTSGSFVVFIIGAIFCTCSSEPKRIESEGVLIDYTDSKRGDTTLLFVHGWNINKTYWKDQVDFFSPNYRVVTMDLPGFGMSGKNRSVWSVENYGKDVAAVIASLELRNVILVGHSMAEEIIVAGALQAPADVIALVGVDNFPSVASPDSIDQKLYDQYFDSLRLNFQTMGREEMRKLFFGVSGSATQRRVMHDFEQVDPDISVDVIRENAYYWPLLNKRLKATHLKVHLINSDKTRVDTMSFQNSQIPYSWLTIKDTGHFPMIEKPNEFNLLLKKVMMEIKRDSRVD